MEKFNNDELVKKYYLGEVSLLDIADEYFKKEYWSAASSFYLSLFNILRNNNDFILKSYICSQLARCYLNQNLDYLSNWQLSTIYNFLRSAINYNPNNILAHRNLADYYLLKNEIKNAYYEYEYIILNLIETYYDELTNDDIIYMFTKFYEIAESLYIIKYKDFESKIYSFLGKQYILSQAEYNKIIKLISDHHSKIDEKEFNIIESKYIYN